MNPTCKRLLAVAESTVMTAGAAGAEDAFKVGASVGLTGYAAVSDRNWRDGLRLVVEQLNAKSGILGHRVEVVVEDNRSHPQDAVVADRKMLSSDAVQVFASGCVSAGNMRRHSWSGPRCR